MIQNSKLPTPPKQLWLRRPGKIQNLGQALIVIVLLFVVFLLPFLSMLNFSPAVDEIAHLPSGYSYLKTGEIKLNPQHPPLIKMLAAVPLLFLDLKFDVNNLNLAEPKVSEWQFGRNFLSENGIDRVIFWGRIPMVLLSVLLGFYIFRWGKELFNYQAGVIGLLVYAFMPNLIAHSQLVTTDMGLAVFSFIALYYLWKFTEHPTKRNTILSGLALGLALGSKFSAVFLLPIFLVLLAVYIQIKHTQLDWLRKFNLLLKFILPIFGLAFFTTWALNFFPTDPLFYWNGLNTVYADHNPDYLYYLNGDFAKGGWWYYFLWAFIIKTPVPFLIALAAALIFWRKNNLGLLNKLFIFLPAAVFLFMASWKAHNIGIRYVLVVYPFLILFVSGQLERIKYYVLSIKRKKLHTTYYILLTTLGGWYVFSAVSIYPDHLAYFNELVGGSKNGYKHLDDSNVDWGQDLKRLAEYQKKNPDLQIVYAWDTYTDAGRLYGIKNILSPNSKNLWLDPSGKYAISTHVVIRTRQVSQINKNEKLNWANNYKPIDRIGQSFFIYEFP